MHRIDALRNSLYRLGDQSELYTQEEKQIIQQFLDLVDADKDLHAFWDTIWREILARNLIIVALRLCNMEAQLLYQTVKALFNLGIKTYPNILVRINTENLKSIADMQMFKTLNRPADQGPAIILFQISKWKPSEANLEELVVYAILFYLTTVKYSPEMQRQGIIGIGDMAGLKLEHIRHVTTIDLLSKIASVLITLPTQGMKGVVLVNCFSLFTRSFNMFKWVLPADIRKLIHVAGKDISKIKCMMIPHDKLLAGLGSKVLDLEVDNGGIDEEIFSDPNIIQLVKHLINEVIIFTGSRLV